jgi:hypothetical protein
MRKIEMALLGLLLMGGLAVAATFAEITISPNSQTIDISGSPNPVVTYTVTLLTDDAAGDPGELSISTDDSAIWAEVGDSTPDQQFSSYPFTVAGTPDADDIITMTFTLYATVDEAVETSVNDELHKIRVKYQDKEGETLAMVTGRINPIPELSTVLLTSAGLIGLIGLVRIKRKD